MTKYVNKAQCGKCKEIVESTDKTAHLWTKCPCTHIGISGGSKELKRFGAHFVELAKKVEVNG